MCACPLFKYGSGEMFHLAIQFDTQARFVPSFVSSTLTAACNSSVELNNVQHRSKEARERMARIYCHSTIIRSPFLWTTLFDSGSSRHHCMFHFFLVVAVLAELKFNSRRDFLKLPNQGVVWERPAGFIPHATDHSDKLSGWTRDVSSRACATHFAWTPLSRAILSSLLPLHIIASRTRCIIWVFQTSKHRIIFGQGFPPQMVRRKWIDRVGVGWEQGEYDGFRVARRFGDPGDDINERARTVYDEDGDGTQGLRGREISYTKKKTGKKTGVPNWTPYRYIVTGYQAMILDPKPSVPRIPGIAFGICEKEPGRGADEVREDVLVVRAVLGTEVGGSGSQTGGLGARNQRSGNRVICRREEEPGVDARGAADEVREDFLVIRAVLDTEAGDSGSETRGVDRGLNLGRAQNGGF
ncbi:hypothetical protein C8R45DRAFT_1069948 [Mycena sanguinolenta]|nr:hypothetical protein C8R45DRAFT_1069948 [Mycena sanguinolenta]